MLEKRVAWSSACLSNQINECIFTVFALVMMRPRHDICIMIADFWSQLLPVVTVILSATVCLPLCVWVNFNFRRTRLRSFAYFDKDLRTPQRQHYYYFDGITCSFVNETKTKTNHHSAQVGKYHIRLEFR